MLGQAPWARLSPPGPTVLLLALCAVMTTQDICNSTRDGDLTAPALFLNTSSAQEGESFSLRCTIDGHSAPTRIVFCKDRMEAHSLKGQLGKLIYTITLKVTQGSEGTYMCGYQLKDDNNRVRSSALSAGRILHVPGAGVTTQDIGSSPGHGNASKSLAGPMAPGACRGRCPRPLHGAGNDEDSSADPSHYYANMDEMGRVKVSSAQAHPCRRACT
nr:uncharacterized protein LOC119715467 isoform X3 [Anas platyrhynchos]XP_038035157.1 uncharacterized protein LOC119716997 isoform X3 [Anas platyrhynchos]